MGLRQFLRDLALLPEMWRRAVGRHRAETRPILSSAEVSALTGRPRVSLVASALGATLDRSNVPTVEPGSIDRAIDRANQLRGLSDDLTGRCP